MATSRRALDEHLPEDAPIMTVPQLEMALTALAIDFGTSIVGSADYAAAFALVAQQRLQTPMTTDDLATEAAAEDLAERIAHFVDVGLLDTDNPRLAADHFSALTILLAYERQPVPSNADPEKVRFNRTMVEELRANRGEVAGLPGGSLLLLHTTGARSGRPRLSPLAYLSVGGRMLVVGSYLGASKAPAWVHNLRANPRAQVEVGTDAYDVIARELPREERDGLWARVTELARASQSPDFAPR